MGFNVVQLPEFEKWLSSIKDGMTRRRLGRRLERAMRGNLGDVEPVGEGDKSTQQKDIKKAIELAKTLQD